MQQQIARLAQAGIHPVEELAFNHFLVFARECFAALVEHRDNRFVRIGTSGVVMEGGLAMLMWRGAAPWLVARGHERLATPEEVDGLRRFSAELSSALALKQ